MANLLSGLGGAQHVGGPAPTSPLAIMWLRMMLRKGIKGAMANQAPPQVIHPVPVPTPYIPGIRVPRQNGKG